MTTKRPFVYLDNNATTKPLQSVVDAMVRAATSAWANPSSLHSAGRIARKQVDEAREEVAELCAVSPRDVVFTSGGTEANNLGLIRLFPQYRGTLVTSRLEHPSVTACAEMLASRGVNVIWLDVPRDGHINVDALETTLRAVDSSLPRLLATHVVQSETGALQPVAKILDLAEKLGIQVHLDAVQAAGRIDPKLWVGAHSVAVASHKMRGPKGIGAIVTHPGIILRPTLFGGSQERGLRPGTVDPVACAGFAVAAKHARMSGPDEYAQVQPLRDRLEQGIVAAAKNTGQDVLITSCEPQAPHTAHFVVRGWPGDELVAALDLEGVCVSSGTACSAGTSEPSPAVSAMVGEDLAKCAVRFSLSPANTAEEIEFAINAVERIFARVRKH